MTAGTSSQGAGLIEWIEKYENDVNIYIFNIIGKMINWFMVKFIERFIDDESNRQLQP